MEKIFVKTFGCSLNRSDSEVMKGILKKAGFEMAEKREDADLVIINTCGVKGPTEANFFKYLEETKELKKLIIIAGCLPKMIPEKLAGNSMIGPHQLTKIVEVVEETLNREIVVLLADGNEKRIGLPKVRHNPAVEIIPICRGCTGNCAYCIVKKARGSLVSYLKEDILAQAKSAIKEGVKEIWLTAQDTGCYGKGTDTNLPSLINAVAALDGDFMIRVGMANPNHVIEFLDQLIMAYKHPKVFKFLHVPVQSGNDEILKSMHRRYTVKEFKEIISRFRKEIPEITIATDIICGFPGETKEQFMDSVNLMSEIKPDVMNISRFWPRPGTDAAEMKKQLTGGETKERSTHIRSIFEWLSLEKNKKWLKWEGEIIIDEKGNKPENKDTFFGRNYCYKPVAVEGNFRFGDKLKVKIASSGIYHLSGIPLALQKFKYG